MFGLNGGEIFVVKRPSATVLEVTSVEGADGYCPTNDCDTVRVVATIAIPSDARIIEEVVELTAGGASRRFDCTGSAGRGDH